MRVLLTGVAGFIGFHTAKRLLSDRHVVLGIDNLNDYYDPNLKVDRLQQLSCFTDFSFEKIDISDATELLAQFKTFQPDIVIHMAAQASVRYSVSNPHIYIRSNVLGFLNVLEGCRQFPVQHFVYASSSSVYGANPSIPFSVTSPQNHPLSLYAATKGSNELMAHSYSHLFSIPSTGLRFFTVYGPWGRPDMAPYLFTKAAFSGEPIDVFNHGEMQRDFTYIDDAVEGVVSLLHLPPTRQSDPPTENPDPSTSWAPYRLLNIGNSRPVPLMAFIQAIERSTGQSLNKNLVPMQPGDAPITYACCKELKVLTGYQPSTSVQEGVQRFVDWYRGYHGSSESA